MNIYLLGAGASKSYEISGTNQKMPLANDFFRTFNNLSISESGWVLVGDIINYLIKKKYINSPADFSVFNYDIEIIHSEIQKHYLDAINREDFTDITVYRKAFNQLVFLFSSVINEIQNGAESEFHKNLVQQMGSEDSFITFNWDTLVDKSLMLNKDWSLKNGYHVKPKMIYNNEWEQGEEGSSKNLLLKLHGSTNWLSSYIFYNYQTKKIEFMHKGQPDTLYAYQGAESEYPCYDGRFMDGYDDFSMGYYPPNLPIHEEGRDIPEGYLGIRTIQRNGINPKGTSSNKGISSMPIIIPPVQNKSYEFYGSLFDNIWSKAEELLSKANVIYVIGYSFPPTDIPSNNLFKSAFSKRSTVPEVVIVNPFPDELEYKFKYEFGIPTNKLKVIPDYITKDYVLSC